MASISAFIIYSVVFSELVFVGLSNPVCPSSWYLEDEIPVYEEDIHQIQFTMNLEYMEAELYLWAVYGHGLDVIAPYLTNGGHPPIGARKANLDPFLYKLIEEFGYQKIGNLRSMNYTVGGIPRPFIDLSPKTFAYVVDAAFGHKLEPPFDPYRDSLSYMAAVYMFPYLNMNGYVFMNPKLKGYVSKRLQSGLLGVNAGQDACVRTYLYERADEIVWPYEFTVAEYTNRISSYFNKLGMCGIKDEGIVVPPQLGAENRTESNALSADYNSLSYARSPQENLRIMYGTGDEHIPGGFYPHGANGKIAREFLEKP